MAPRRRRRVSAQLALLLSVVLSPFLVVPVFCVLLAGELARSQTEFYLLSFLCTFFSIGIPLGYISWNLYLGKITDIHVRVREQRVGVYRAGILGLAALTAVLYGIKAPILLTRVAFLMAVHGIVFERVNRRMKISMHTGVLAAMLSCAIEILQWSPACLLALVPLIWARLKRRRHRLEEGMLGAVLGYALTTYPLRLMEYIWG